MFEHAETSYLRAGKTGHDSITFAGHGKQTHCQPTDWVSLCRHI